MPPLGDLPARNIDQREELGYILLQNCELVLDSDIPQGKWLEVSRLLERAVTLERCSSSCTTAFLCPVVESSRQNQSRFMNEVSIMERKKDDRTTDCDDCHAIKSDAIVLAGMLNYCSTVVKIERCQLFRTGEDRGYLVLSLSFPNLSQGLPGKRSLLQQVSMSKNVSQPLHPTMQLILSLLRSDWDFLENARLELERAYQQKELPMLAPGVSLFPTTCSLDELYQRVNPSPLTNLISERLRDMTSFSKKKCQDESILLQQTPELLVDHVAPFLEAKTLLALRCTCSYLYKTLRFVVPGLKLKLFKHQLRSLLWMRERESQQLTESSLLQLSNSSPHAIDGDAHRAATGGISVLLASRSNPLATFRINQLTGKEMDVSSLGEIGRAVARGGLLCDDPGLGKTITVLALILQTAGMSSQWNSQRVHEIGPETLFDMYWREEYSIPLLRTNPLLSLLNRFARVHSIDKKAFARVTCEVEGPRYSKFALFEADFRYVSQFLPTIVSMWLDVEISHLICLPARWLPPEKLSKSARPMMSIFDVLCLTMRLLSWLTSSEDNLKRQKSSSRTPLQNLTPLLPRW